MGNLPSVAERDGANFPRCVRANSRALRFRLRQLRRRARRLQLRTRRSRGGRCGGWRRGRSDGGRRTGLHGDLGADALRKEVLQRDGVHAGERREIHPVERARELALGDLGLDDPNSYVLLAALLIGPINVGGLNIFDVHTRALLLLAGIGGIQFYVFGCMCYVLSADKPTKLSRYLINMDEGVLFFGLSAVLFGMAAVVAYVFIVWIRSGFSGLHLSNILIPAIHFLAVLLLLCMGGLGIHVLKRYEWD